MMKLTESQQRVLEDAKNSIDYARTHDFIHWLSKCYNQYDLEEDWDAHPNPYLSNKAVLKAAQELAEKDKRPVMHGEREIFPANYRRTVYENERNGITRTITSSNTLRALERRGLIRIIKDAGSGVDHIQVLDY